MAEFKIGDQVKLKKYTPHTDYKTHTGQKAVILGPSDGHFDLRVRWADGTFSHVDVDNLVSASGAVETAEVGDLLRDRYNTEYEVIDTFNNSLILSETDSTNELCEVVRRSRLEAEEYTFVEAAEAAEEVEELTVEEISSRLGKKIVVKES